MTQPILSFLYNRRNLYILGLLIAIIVTFMEFTRGRHMNFIAFADATSYFWQGISPYTDAFVSEHKRFFLYTPLFSVLFTPFALLPAWLGPFAWNIFNYTLFFVSIFTLPKRFTNTQKCHAFLFLLPILGQSLLSFQYNITVAYLFLFAYTLLESNRAGWAVLLIMISGCTKIYGIFELALLLCYPHFWRNILYAIGMGVVLLALPLLKLSPAELLPYYGEWLTALSIHQSDTIYESLFYARPITEYLLPHFRLLQIGTLGVLALLFFANFRKWASPTFRVQTLGILMGWVVLLSDSAEKHTYIIALAGFAIWYWSRRHRTRLDKILFWSCFAMLCIVPVDLIVPMPVMRVLTATLWLHVWVFVITWLRMIWLTFFHPTEEQTATAPTCAPNIDTLDIVCPCYNPAEGFIELLSSHITALRTAYTSKRFHLIVVNDGSTRGFGEAEHTTLLRTIPDAEIVDIHHGGKGAAIRAGIERSTAPATIYTDIDMPYRQESMHQVIERVLAGVDVVIAVRNNSYHSKLSPMRKMMSYGSKMLNRIFLNTCHTDTQGGLKGLSARAREVMLRTRINDFLFDTEFVVYASQDKRLSIEEIETTLRDGIVMSKMSVKVLIRELKNFFRIALNL